MPSYPETDIQLAVKKLTVHVVLRTELKDLWAISLTLLRALIHDFAP